MNEWRQAYKAHGCMQRIGRRRRSRPPVAQLCNHRTLIFFVSFLLWTRCGLTSCACPYPVHVSFYFGYLINLDFHLLISRN